MYIIFPFFFSFLYASWWASQDAARVCEVGFHPHRMSARFEVGARHWSRVTFINFYTWTEGTEGTVAGEQTPWWFRIPKAIRVPSDRFLPICPRNITVANQTMAVLSHQASHALLVVGTVCRNQGVLFVTHRATAQVC